MIKNVVDYLNYKEGVRANKARETENTRSNKAKEYENTRHNVAVENESVRHNISTEDLGWANLNENTRHNLVSEGEIHRSNLANEAIGKQNADANTMNAQSNRIQAKSAAKLRESQTRNTDVDTRINREYGYELANSQINRNDAQSKQALSSSRYTDKQNDWYGWTAISGILSDVGRTVSSVRK